MIDLKNINIKKLVDNDSSLLWMIVISFIVLVLWASMSKLDVVSLASGNVIPSSKVKQIQHLEGGIVQEIKIKEGQKIKKDEPLLVLSSISNKSDLGELNVRIISLKADIYRLETEAKGKKSIDFPKEFLLQNQSLVDKTNELFKSRIDSLNSKISTQKKAIEEIEARLENSIERFALAKEQVQIGEELIKENLSNRYEQVNRLKELSQVESSIAQDKAAIKKAKEQLKNIKTEYKQDVQTELSQSRQSLKEYIKRKEKFDDSLSRTIITSPMDGIIKTLNVVTIGGVVRSGETIIEIVPLDDKLVVEAKLSPQDIGHIQKNAPAFVQIDGTDGYRYGKVYGKVIHISPDSLITEKGEAFFIVKIELEKQYFGKEERIELFPGMLVSVGIVLGERSVLEYILSPFLQNSSFTFTEK
jgi:adhesin transport system membrane fusion protein